LSASGGAFNRPPWKIFQVPELVTSTNAPRCSRPQAWRRKAHAELSRLLPGGIKSPGGSLRSRNDVFAAGTRVLRGRPVGWFRDNAAIVAKLIETFAPTASAEASSSTARSAARACRRASSTRGTGRSSSRVDIRWPAIVTTIVRHAVRGDRPPSVPEIWRGERRSRRSTRCSSSLAEGAQWHANAQGIVRRRGHSREPLLRGRLRDWLIISTSEKYGGHARTNGSPPTHETRARGLHGDYVVRALVNALGRLAMRASRFRERCRTCRSSPTHVLDLHKECDAEGALEEKGFGERQIRNAITRTLAGVYASARQREA